MPPIRIQICLDEFQNNYLKLTCFFKEFFNEVFLICNRVIFITTTFFAVEEEELSSVPLTFQKWSSRLCLSSSVLSTSCSLEICVSDTVSDNVCWFDKATSCRKPRSNAWFCSQWIHVSPIYVQWQVWHIVLTGGGWEAGNLVPAFI